MSSTESTNQQTEHHESLWYEDGNIVLQAQCVLFKVHRGILARQSDFFKNMFTLPGSGEAEGTDARPLPIPEVSSRGLGHLLMMLYSISGYDLPLSDDEFVEVLRAAHRFQFREVLEIVPRHLDRRLPAERKLELGMQCELDYWRLRPFQELVLSFCPRDPAHDRLGDSVWVQVLVARAQITQARIEYITANLDPRACGHVLAALVSSVPFSSPDEYRSKYWACHASVRRLPSGLYYGSRPHSSEHPCCKSSAKFDLTGGLEDQLHTVLLPTATEHAIIAAVWNPA